MGDNALARLVESFKHRVKTFLRAKRSLLILFWLEEDVDDMIEAAPDWEKVPMQVMRCSEKGCIGSTLFAGASKIVAYKVYALRVSRFLQEVIDDNFSDASIDRYKDSSFEKFHSDLGASIV